MTMNFFIVIYIGVISALLQSILAEEISYAKCCAPKKSINKSNVSNSSYVCEDSSSIRLQLNNIVTIKNNSVNKCVENYRNNVTLFTRLHNEEFKKDRILDVEIFPKCCPIGFRYNSVYHACSDKISDDGDPFVNKTYIAVGLSECLVIIDYKCPAKKVAVEDLLLELRKNLTKNEKYCIDLETDNAAFIVRRCKNDLEICKEIRCFRKCCQDGQSYFNGANCVDSYTYGLDIQSPSYIGMITNPNDTNFAIVHGELPRNIYMLNQNDKVFIDSEGNYNEYVTKENKYNKFSVDKDIYCLEYLEYDTTNEYVMLRMHSDLQMKFSITRWVKAVSCICLILTIFVYVVTSKTKTLFGKILVSYCTATFWTYFGLTYSQFNTQQSTLSCTIVGFLTIFASICSFTWLNIMCIDLYLALGTLMTRNEKKMLIFYSLYGWGGPLVLTMLLFLMSRAEFIPEILRPSVGNTRCFIETEREGEENYSSFYITIPMSIQQIANICLFIKIIIHHCSKVKGKVNEMNAIETKKSMSEIKLRADKEKLNLIIKLAVIMGIHFIFEMVSSYYDFSKNRVLEYIEVVGDTITCLQGVFIFIIFVCKKSIFKELASKCFRVLPGSLSFSSTSSSIHLSLQNISPQK